MKLVGEAETTKHRMDEIHLDEFPEDIYIKLYRTFTEMLFERAIRSFGLQKMLARHLSVGDRTILHWKKGERAIPVKVVLYLSKLLGIEINEIEKHVASYGLKTSNKKVGFPKLPIKITSSLGRILGHLTLGDGSIGRRDFDPAYVGDLSVGKEFLRTQFKHCCEEVFGKVPFRENRYTSGYGSVCERITLPGVIGKLLVRSFGDCFSVRVKIPERIFDFQDVLSATLSAIYDDDASVSYNVKTGMRQIKMETNQKEALLQIKHILKGVFNIDASKVFRVWHGKRKKFYWNLAITGKENLRKFVAKIGFSHPQKRKNLKRMLASYRD